MDLQQKLRCYEEKKGIEYVIPTPAKEVSRQVAYILSHFRFKWSYGNFIRTDDDQFLRCVCIFPSGGMWGDALPKMDGFKLIAPRQFLRILKDINARGQ